MNKKLIFRILGALASALIIVAVFVPFVSVTGYTMSLWESFEMTNALYLPIMIIVFGVIGVVFFALNIKTEFAYMSTGAISFFVVMQTIDVMNQGLFNTLSIGYYFLAVGAILTGFMAFLTNLKSKDTSIKNKETMEQQEPSIINQIDQLYNNDTNLVQNNVPSIEPVQPIDVIAPIEPIQPIPEVGIQPEIQTPQQINQSVIPEPIQEQTINPVVQEFSQPVVEPMTPTVESVKPNPVVQEFSQSPNESIVQEQTINPVVQEFTNQNQVNTQQSTQELDIFGQPINK